MCYNPDKTDNHVIRCPDERVKEQWQNYLAILEMQLEKLHTPSILINTIIQQLLRWRDPTHQIKGEKHISIVVHQSVIGWHNFLFRRLSPEWLRAHQYLQPSETGHKNKRWVSQLIRKLFDVAWDLWDHRNGILHSPLHPWRIEEYHRTDAEIREQFAKGTNDLKTTDHYRLESLDQVLQYDHHTKIQWLGSIKAARSHFADSQIPRVEGPNQQVANMRIGLHNWLRGSHSGNS